LLRSCRLRRSSYEVVSNAGTPVTTATARIGKVQRRQQALRSGARRIVPAPRQRTRRAVSQARADGCRPRSAARPAMVAKHTRRRYRLRAAAESGSPSALSTLQSFISCCGPRPCLPAMGFGFVRLCSGTGREQALKRRDRHLRRSYCAKSRFSRAAASRSADRFYRPQQGHPLASGPSVI
jgi:hypothetical protein